MKIVPKLELKKKSDIELDEFTEDRVDDLTGNANFPVTDPALADVEAKRVLFHDAVLAAINGTPAQTQTKNQLRDELELMDTNLAFDVAKRSNGDLAKYLSSGFSAKKQPVPAGQPNTPIDFLLVFTKNQEEGKLLAKWKKVENAKIYEVMIGTTPYPPDDSANPSSGSPAPPMPGPDPSKDWGIAGAPTAAKLVITELTSGTKYYARARAIGTGGSVSGWSDIASKMCP